MIDASPQATTWSIVSRVGAVIGYVIGGVTLLSLILGVPWKLNDWVHGLNDQDATGVRERAELRQRLDASHLVEVDLDKRLNEIVAAHNLLAAKVEYNLDHLERTPLVVTSTKIPVRSAPR